MEDKQIIDLFWQRSESAITAAAEKYGPYCQKIAENILESKEDAEECVNDTWLLAWKNIPPDKPAKLAAYLGKITRNLSLNCVKYHAAQKRGSGRTELVLSELEDCIPAPNSVENEMDDRFLKEAIERYLRALPAEKRHIFIRRYWYMMSVKEIAKACGMSQSKIASLLFRMRKELKAHLEKEGIWV